MKKLLKIFVYTISALLIAWAVLTVWVEAQGKPESSSYGNISSSKKVLIVYDPDPFYNLDKMVCTAFGQALSAKGLYVNVASVAAAKESADEYDTYVFCANTYNWRPDWALTDFIAERTDLQSKQVVAITLGAGSTEASQKALEALLLSKGCKIVSSNSLWLMRPNDESRMDESNVKVAESVARAWGTEIAKQITKGSAEQTD
jgi:hypothetical protein